MKFYSYYLLFFVSISPYCQGYKIKYDEYINIDPKSIEKATISDDKDNIDSMFFSKKVLLYTKGLSSYAEESDVKYRVEEKFNETTEIVLPGYYKNHEKRETIKFFQNYFPVLYGQDILLVTSIEKHDWKITNKVSEISGYNCKLAKYKRPNGTQILAWYSDEIAINEGPRDYWGLPGLILKLQINEKVLLVARSITKINDDSIVVELPEDENIMNQEEFDELQAELSKPQVITLPDGSQVIQR